MPASEWAAVSAARQMSGGAETSARGEKDGESEGRLAAGSAALASGCSARRPAKAVPADCPTPINRISHGYASLGRPAGARASVIT
ncbi:hypothetical protein AQJ30_07005 [Streptomyces longwoodensis]|uniref:Uncharacterized protein n=1 Tax=Streptomyces longwoodensis TaxID=68231 RepID=A0A101R2B4_9ACTN|nr:hypothetical protein AQJ30_07005 [Streptomyces longwoodensis]